MSPFEGPLVVRSALEIPLGTNVPLSEAGTGGPVTAKQRAAPLQPSSGQTWRAERVHVWIATV